MKKGSIIIFALIILCAMFSVGYVFGTSQQTSDLFLDETVAVEEKESDGRVDFGLFWNAWDLLKKKYVDSDTLVAQDLVYGAISGMFAATEDPYTVFLDPRQSRAFNEELDGSFQGIGAEIGIKDNILTIVSPLDDSPAERAGLFAGDRIIDIDGEQATDLSIEDAVLKIRGKKGTDVVLTIFRDGAEDTMDIVITRDDIVIKSVRSDDVVDGMAYIRLAQFGDDTFDELSAALQQSQAAGMQGVVIDLRNNPGGLLTTAVQVTGLFVEPRSVTLIEKDAEGNEKKHKTRGNGQYKNLPVVLLQNQGSASASEIFAGALKDNRNDVVVVGTTSFGKGSVQELVPMRDGAAAKITVAKWYTPSNREIDGVGLSPDHEIEITAEDFQEERDPQRDKAFDLLREVIANDNL